VLAPEVETEIQRLLAAGEHAAAAAALRHHGEGARAGKLYEQIFEHAIALSCFEHAGDIVSAVRVAITLNDNNAIDRLVTEAIARGLGDALIGSLLKAGRHREVGRVYLARGEHMTAARAFDDAGAWSDAARCYEELGNAREAGVFLERWLELHPDDDQAALRLGRILARFGRHDDAITLLQRAVQRVGPHERDAVLCRAAPTLALAFAALGYDEAARTCVRRWQKAHARLQKTGAVDVDAPPASLDALLGSARAAAFRAVQETPKSASSTSSKPAQAASKPPTSTKPADSFDALLGANPDGATEDGAVDDVRANDGDVDEGAGDQAQLLLNGRYLLGEPLGGGGVGQVFRAHDAFADRPVAVKIFGAQVLASDAVQAWAREARAAAALGHPALVKLVELNMAQGFVVSELHGEDDNAQLLEERLKRGGEGGWLLPVCQQVLDALSASHRTGLVHGGLKPQNIFIVPGGVKLLDFGAHRLLALRSTETGGLASVWPYLSPQLLIGQPADVDGDLYAVAAIVYRALTGRPPFSAATADRSAPPPLARTLNATVPESWELFLARALHPDVAQRFASADEMRAALPTTSTSTLTLPKAVSLGGLVVANERKAAGDERYIKGALVQRGGGTRTYEAQDALVSRPVWLIEADGDGDALLPFVAAARLWRGVQPVYDVIADDVDVVRQVVLARDKTPLPEASAAFAAARAVPQGLTRDLTAVAEALAALHAAGFAVGGFDVDRARGPVGPRLRLAPAPLLIVATASAVAADWAAFDAVVDAAFDVVPDATLDPRGRLLATLHDGRFLERADLEFLAQSAAEPWLRFLPKVTERLVQSATARVVARLVKSVVRA
jgi:tetratricopeptide (TPR) repeat protein